MSCIEILAQSYNRLPSHLKSCFLYFGVYPKDFEIPVRRLIRLWIAEGFIRQIGNRNIEDVAEDYLEELINRSLIQVATKRLDGRVKTCRIHDLLRDLCISKSSEEKFLEVHSNVNLSPKIAESSGGDAEAEEILHRQRRHVEEDPAVGFALDTEALMKQLIQESSQRNVVSDLPLGLVQEIINRITTFKNFIAAKGVSRDWRSAGLSNSRRPQLPLPGLMLSEPLFSLFTNKRTLFSLYDRNHLQLQISEVRGKRCWGSQHGWVVTLGPRYVTQLVHLIKGKQINLPPLDTIQSLDPREEWFCLVHQFILLKDPSDESTFLVIAIFGPMNSLAFTRVRVEAALNGEGPCKWDIVANPGNLKFLDVTRLKDDIYALCNTGKLVRFVPDAPLADMVQEFADHPEFVGEHQKIYLVESLGNLYMVLRNGFLIPSERTHETTSFFVYKFNFNFNFNTSPWEEVTHLEGQTFFVGDGNSFSWRFPTSIFPSRSDCIYFTDDHWEWRKFLGVVAYGGHDVGLFDMAIRDILPLTFGKDKPCYYSRPIFVTRNDKL